MQRLEALLNVGGVKKEILFLVVSGIALFINLFDLFSLPFDAAWIAIILCGLPIILEAVIGLVTDFDIKADVLVSIALIASIIIGENFAAGEIAFIMQLGALLEDLTVTKAQAGIEKLVNLTPQTARRITNDSEEIIPAEKVMRNDVLRILPGETIPVDGLILSGETSVNQAVMTGESLPVDKSSGDFVSSGTVNQFGTFDMKATKVGEDSSIQRMVRLVQSADAGKAKIVGVADRWATWIVIIALTSAALTWFITDEIIRAVTILVVFCPCALVLATPTAIVAAIGNATKHSFLVREGDALERLAGVSAVTFDKTGTLTYGTPQVTAVHSYSETVSQEELFLYAASVESRSEHPLGKAVLHGFRASHASELFAPKQFKMLPGRGVKAILQNQEVAAGNLKLLKEEGIELTAQEKSTAERYVNQGCTIIYLTVNRTLSGFLALSDTLREDAFNVIGKLKEANVSPVLLTGDHKNAAQSIANQLGIHQVHADCLPENKLQWIEAYQEQSGSICMIGDGINDAPALKKAFVGIAMGGIGSDIAVDAADIVLVDDDIKELPHLLSLSKRMMKTIKYNLAFSLTLNFIAIILAMTGVLNPILGALVHNAGSILVIVNSSLLLNWRKKI